MLALVDQSFDQFLRRLVGCLRVRRRSSTAGRGSWDDGVWAPSLGIAGHGLRYLHGGLHDRGVEILRHRVVLRHLGG